MIKDKNQRLTQISNMTERFTDSKAGSMNMKGVTLCHDRMIHWFKLDGKYEERSTESKIDSLNVNEWILVKTERFRDSNTDSLKSQLFKNWLSNWLKTSESQPW